MMATERMDPKVAQNLAKRYWEVFNKQGSKEAEALALRTIGRDRILQEQLREIITGVKSK